MSPPPPPCSATLLMKPSAMLISLVAVLFTASVVSSAPVPFPGGTFNQNFDLTWGGDRAKIFSGGQLLSLTLDRVSGSGFQSKKEYLFGRIDMQLKLVPGNSAGTVTAYYLSSQGPTHDEIDFEFLGNLSGHPYTLHTNVYTQGKGNREMQFHLWFDPTINFHTYSIVWNPQRIIYMVDNTPIREFVSMEAQGVPFPNKQPMRLFSSLWDAEDWATQGGRVKTDWSKAPFIAYYRNFVDSSSSASREWQNMALDPAAQKRLKWVQDNYMIYNYCTDYKRFPQGLPPECKH